MGNGIVLKEYEIDSFSVTDDDEWLKKPCSSFWDRDVLQNVNNSLHSMFDSEIVSTDIASRTSESTMTSSSKPRLSKKSCGYTCNRQVICDIYQVLGVSDPVSLDANGKTNDLSFCVSLNDRANVFTSNDLIMASYVGLNANGNDNCNDDFKQSNNFCQYKSIDESGLCHLDDDVTSVILSEQSNVLLKEAPKAGAIHAIIACNTPNNMRTVVLQLQNRLRRRALLRLHLAIHRHSSAKATGNSSSDRQWIYATDLGAWTAGVFRKPPCKRDERYRDGSPEASADLIIATSLTSSISMIAGLRDQLLMLSGSGRDSSDIASLYNTQMRRLSTSLLQTLAHAVHPSSSDPGAGKAITPIAVWDAASSSSQLDFFKVGGTACASRKEGLESCPTVWARPTDKVTSLAFVVADLRTVQPDQPGGLLSVGVCMDPSGFPRADSEGLGKCAGSWGIVDDRNADTDSSIFASATKIGAWRKFRSGDVVVLTCNFIENFFEISVNACELYHRFDLPGTGETKFAMGVTLSGDLSLRIIPVSATRLIPNPVFSAAVEAPLLRAKRIVGEAPPTCANAHSMVAMNELPLTYAHQHGPSLVAVNCNNCLRSGIQEDVACFYHCSECSHDLCFCCSVMQTSSSASTSKAPSSLPTESSVYPREIDLILKAERPLATAALEQLALLFREDIIFRSISSAVGTSGAAALAASDHPLLAATSNPFIRKYVLAQAEELLSREVGAHQGSTSLTILFCLSVLQYSLAGVLEVVHYLLDRSLDEGGGGLLLLERARFAAEHLRIKGSEGGASRGTHPVSLLEATIPTSDLLFSSNRASVDGGCAFKNSHFDWVSDSSIGRPEGQAVYLMSLLAKISASEHIFCIEDDHIFGVLLDMLAAAAAALASSFIVSVEQQQPCADMQSLHSRSKLQIHLGGYALAIIHHSIAKLCVEKGGAGGISKLLDSPLPEELLSSPALVDLPRRLQTARRLYGHKLDRTTSHYTPGDEVATAECNSYRGRIAVLLDLIIMNPLIDPDSSLIASYAVRLAATRHILSASPSEQFERIVSLLGSAQAGDDTPSERALCMQWMSGLEGPNALQLLHPPLDGKTSGDGDRFFRAMLSLADRALCGKCESLCATGGAEMAGASSSALQEQVLRVLEPIAVQSIGSMFSSILTLSTSNEPTAADTVKDVVCRLVQFYELLIASARDSISTIVGIFSLASLKGDIISEAETFKLAEQVVDSSHVGSLVPLSLLSLSVLWRDMVALGQGGLCDSFVALSEQLKQLSSATCSAIALKAKINPLSTKEASVAGPASPAPPLLLPDRLLKEPFAASEPVYAWEPTVSNTSLEFSENNGCCKRPGSVSCYPAAFSLVPKPISSFSVLLDEAGSRTNWLSVGLCKVGFATSSSDGFGRTANSWGIADDRSKEGEPAFFACAGHRSGPAPRKLKVGDKVTVTVDLVQGTVTFSVNTNEFSHVFGGLSSADSAQVGPRGDPRDFWFGATFANDHKLRIVTSQASPSSSVSLVPHVETSWLMALSDEVSSLQLLCLQQLLEKRADNTSSVASDASSLIEQESSCQIWLDNPLFEMGFVQTAPAHHSDDSTKFIAFDDFEVNKTLLTQAQREQWELLHQLTDAPNGLGPSQRLVNIMKRVVMRDRGSDSGPNHIVHAAIAAMIWHEGHGAEALDLARGETTVQPSKILEQIWALAQDLRLIYVGDERSDDCESASELDTPISMERQYSLPPPREGQSLLNDTALAAVRRARLLMTFLPTKFIMGSSLKDQKRSSKQTSSVRSKLVVAESVLRFIKYGPDPDLMRDVVHRRTRAARSRAEGFALASELLGSRSESKTQAALLRNVADSLHRVSDCESSATAQHVHYLGRIRGSAYQEQYALQCAWSEFVGRIIDLSTRNLRDLAARQLFRPPPFSPASGTQDGAVAEDDVVLDSVLSAFAVLSLDYVDSHNSVDLSMLKERGIDALFRCALASSSQSVRTVAVRVLELLLHACSFALCADLPTNEERDLIKALLSDLIELQTAYFRQAAISYSQGSLPTSKEMVVTAAPASKFALLRGEAVCDPSEEGITAFAQPLYASTPYAVCTPSGADHSFSIWLWCPSHETEGVFFSKFDGPSPAWTFMSFYLQRGGYLSVELGGSCWTSQSSSGSGSKAGLVEPTRVVLAARSPLHCSKWVHVGLTADFHHEQLLLYVNGCHAATGVFTPQMAAGPHPYADLLADAPADCRNTPFFIGQAPSVFDSNRNVRPSASCVVANANLYLAALSQEDYARIAVADLDDYFASNKSVYTQRLHLDNSSNSSLNPFFRSEQGGVVFCNSARGAAPLTAYVTAPRAGLDTRLTFLVGDMGSSSTGLSIGLCFADQALQAHSVYIECDDTYTRAGATFTQPSFFSGNVSDYDPRSEIDKIPALEPGDLVFVDLSFHEDFPQVTVSIACAGERETFFFTASLSCLQGKPLEKESHSVLLSQEMFTFAVTASAGQRVQLLSSATRDDFVSASISARRDAHDVSMRCIADGGGWLSRGGTAAGSTQLEHGQLCCWDVGAMMLQPVCKKPGENGMVVSTVDFLQSLSLLARVTKYMLMCTCQETHIAAGARRSSNFLSKLVLGEGALQALVQAAFDNSSSTVRLAATSVLRQLMPLVNINVVYRCFHNLGFMHFLHSADSSGYKSVDMGVAEMSDQDYMGTGQLFLTSLVQLLGLLMNPFGGQQAVSSLEQLRIAGAPVGADALLVVRVHRGDATFASVIDLPCHGRHLLAHQVHQILQALVDSPISYWRSMFNTFLPPLLDCCQEGLRTLTDGSGVEPGFANLLLGALAVSGGWRHELGLFPGTRVTHRGQGSSLHEGHTVVGYAPGTCFGSAVLVIPDDSTTDSSGPVDETERSSGGSEPEMVFATYLLSEQSVDDCCKGGRALLEMAAPGTAALAGLLMAAITSDTADGRPAPRQLIGSKDTRSVVFESPHPHRDAIDEVFEVSIPGATELTVAFHRDTKTESSQDYLRFYKDATKAQYYGREKYSGGAGWPGVDGVDALKVSSGSCVVHFHSERGSAGWGYRFMVTGEIAAPAPAAPPALPELTLLRLAKLMAVDIASKTVIRYLSQNQNPALRSDTSVAVLSGAWRSLLQTVVVHNLLESASGDGDDRATINLSAVPPSKIRSVAGLWQRSILTKPLCPSLTVGDASHGESVWRRERDLIAAPAYEGLVRYFQGLLEDPTKTHQVDTLPQPPAARKSTDADKRHPRGVAGSKDVASSGLLGALAPSANSPMFHAADSASLTEIADGGLGVTRSGAYSSSSEGVKYKLRCIAGTTHCRIRSLPSLDSQEVGDVKNGSIVEISGEINGFYSLANRSGYVKRLVEGAVDWERVGDGDGSVLCCTDVEGQLHRDLDAAVSLGCYQLLCALMQSWTIDKSLLGLESGGELLLLLRVCGVGKIDLGAKASGAALLSRKNVLMDGCSGPETPLLAAFMNMVSASSRGAGAAVASLTTIAQTLLTKIKALASSAEATSSVIPPPPPPPVVLESLHEYENNADFMTHVHIPGASSLEISFDAECSTERNYDYVAIYADERRKSIISAKFSGRKHSGDKNWPGVDGRPPLVLEGRDKCWVSFVSDGSNTDWGWRLSVCGIFQDGKSALSSFSDFDVTYLAAEPQAHEQSVAIIPVHSRVLLVGGCHYRAYFGLALALCSIVTSLDRAADFMLTTTEGRCLLESLTSCSSIIRSAHHSLLHLFIDINCRIFLMSSTAGAIITSPPKDDMKTLLQENKRHFHLLADCVLHLASSVESAYKVHTRAEPRTVVPPPLMQAIAQAAIAAMSWKIKHRTGTRRGSAAVAAAEAGEKVPAHMAKLDPRALCLLSSHMCLTHAGLGLHCCPEQEDKAPADEASCFAWGPAFPPSRDPKLPYTHIIYVRLARQFSGAITIGVAPLAVAAPAASTPLVGCVDTNMCSRGPLGSAAHTIGMQLACSSDDAKQCRLSACDGTERSSQECPSFVQEGDLLSITLFVGTTGWSVDLCRNGVLIGRVDAGVHPTLFAESLAAYVPAADLSKPATPLQSILAVAVMLPPDAEVVFEESRNIPLAARKQSADDAARPPHRPRAPATDDAAAGAVVASESEHECVVLKRWDIALSDPYLVFSDAGTSALRPGSVSCYPASLVPFHEPSCSLTMTLIDCPSGPNSMSFGIAHGATFQKTSSDGMGQTVNSWGLIESRASGDGKLISNRTFICSFRKMQEADMFCIRYERSLGKAWLIINGGEFTQEFEVHPPGEVVELVAGATFCNDHCVRIVDAPPPPLRAVSAVAVESRVHHRSISFIVNQPNQIKAWDRSLSQPNLLIFQGGRRVSRPAHCPPFPAAFAAAAGPRCSMTIVIDECAAAAKSTSIGFAVAGFPLTGPQPLGEREGSWGVGTSRAAHIPPCTHIFANGTLVDSFREFLAGDIFVMVIDHTRCSATLAIKGVDGLELSHCFSDLPEGRSFVMGATLCSGTVLSLSPSRDPPSRDPHGGIDDQTFPTPALASAVPDHMRFREGFVDNCRLVRFAEAACGATGAAEELFPTTLLAMQERLYDVDLSQLGAYLHPLKASTDLFAVMLSTSDKLVPPNFIYSECVPFACAARSRIVEVPMQGSGEVLVDVDIPEAIGFAVRVLQPSQLPQRRLVLSASLCAAGTSASALLSSHMKLFRSPELCSEQLLDCCDLLPLSDERPSDSDSIGRDDVESLLLRFRAGLQGEDSTRAMSSLLPGDTVVRGPSWAAAGTDAAHAHICGDSDGSPGGLGDVVAVNKGSIECTVRWRCNGRVVTYPAGDFIALWHRGVNETTAEGSLSRRSIVTTGLANRLRVRVFAPSEPADIPCAAPARLLLLLVPFVLPSRLLGDPLFAQERRLLMDWYRGSASTEQTDFVGTAQQQQQQQRKDKKLNRNINIAVVKAAEAVAKTRHLPLDSLLNARWADLRLAPMDVLQHPALAALLAAEAASGLHRYHLPLSRRAQVEDEPRGAIVYLADVSSLLTRSNSNPADDAAPHSFADPTASRIAASRFALIVAANNELLKCIDLINIGARDSSVSQHATAESADSTRHSYSKKTLAHMLNKSKGLIFSCVKDCVISACINRSETSGSSKFELIICRPRAALFASRGEVDHEGRWSIFGQAFRKLHGAHPSLLRKSGQIWDTVFAGERAQDAGGPYREVWSGMAEDLVSPHLPLLKSTPNSLNNVGGFREALLLNPHTTAVYTASAESASARSTRLEMFVFLGKLLGSAARSKNYMDICLAPMVWKLLLEETVSVDDLADVDYTLVNWLSKLKRRDGLSADNFESEYPDMFFTTVSYGGQTVELHSGGASEALKWGESIDRYCEEVVSYKLAEMAPAIHAVRAGLLTQLPQPVLHLLCWEELEEKVCGRAAIDMALLKSITEYERGFSPSDPHIVWLWELLEDDFSIQDKKAFLRFTWGRAKLPTSRQAFSQVLKIQGLHKSPADSYLPVAHTCFFSIEIPRYSSKDIMREKMLYAIYNCIAIDGDETSAGYRAGNLAAGWDSV